MHTATAWINVNNTRTPCSVEHRYGIYLVPSPPAAGRNDPSPKNTSVLSYNSSRPSLHSIPSRPQTKQHRHLEEVSPQKSTVDNPTPFPVPRSTRFPLHKHHHDDPQTLSITIRICFSHPSIPFPPPFALRTNKRKEVFPASLPGFREWLAGCLLVCLPTYSPSTCSSAALPAPEPSPQAQHPPSLPAVDM
jgi:hypothetical protein